MEDKFVHSGMRIYLAHAFWKCVTTEKYIGFSMASHRDDAYSSSQLEHAHHLDAYTVYAFSEC